jgi:sortase A
MDPYSVPVSSPPTRARKSRAVRGIEYGLWLIACVALGSLLWTWVDAWRHQTEGSRALATQVTRADSKVAPGRALRIAPAYGSAVARIEVARLGLSTVVFEGTGDDVLAHGAGHLSGSALPGDPGNVVFAGHRDTFFRPLRDLREGDVVTVTDGNGMRRYVVQSTQVVKPNNVGVLAATSAPMLTLITCYPFRFVGSAPERFVARCREVRDAQALPVAVTTDPPATIASPPAPPRARLAAVRSKPNRAPVVAPPASSDSPLEAVPDNAGPQEPAPVAVDESQETSAAATPAPKRRWPARWLGKLTHAVHRGSNPD